MWMSNFMESDQYFIIPLLSVAIFYYVFGLGITAANKFKPMGRIRAMCQLLMILWLPFLASWPGSIGFYILCNAIYTLF